jgi:peptidoglycan hydrolase-like protein with peptidoglycan-binding domain
MTDVRKPSAGDQPSADEKQPSAVSHQPSADEDQPPANSHQPSARRKTWWIVGISLLAAIVAGVAIGAIFASSEPEEETAVALNTATVERTDVVATETLSGTLGFESSDPVAHRTSTQGITTVRGFASGVVTSITDEGAVLESGDVLYAINAEPVVVLGGDVPVYRSFNSRMSDGSDVEQLEQALFDLGFDPDEDMTIDEDFTSATADAIERLQESIGSDETGRLDLGYIVFAPDVTYVAEVFVVVGDETGPGSPIIATSRSIAGTATSVAAEGSTVGNGEPLVFVDEEPIVLLLGDLPSYRTLSQGDFGADVRQLERALDDLGFGESGLRIDDTFDDDTSLAVVAFQVAVGANPDGVVNLGDVVFLPEAIRIGDALVSVGQTVANGTPLVSTSASSTTVSVELSTDDQDLVEVGDAVAVEMPDGSRESATVTEIGTVVQANQQGVTYFEMTVTLDDPEAAEGLDEAPVDVDVVGDRADDVLAVPVTALLALAEGGYAVEVMADDGSVLLIAVDPGLFADGLVEVTSGSLVAGMAVVIP